jgi:hypothetical protein
MWKILYTLSQKKIVHCQISIICKWNGQNMDIFGDKEHIYKF